MPEEFSFSSPDDKKQYVERMFSKIARRYDFFNHLLSAGFDRAWRRRAIQILRERLQPPPAPRLEKAAEFRILDIASGTGDLAIEGLRQLPGAKITATDLAETMLDYLRKKPETSRFARIERADVEALQFADNSFDGVTIGFGTRNFTSLPLAFKEIHRVLRPGGVFINLELARPRPFPMKQLYRFYFDMMLPKLAQLFAGDRSAYRYLPDSLRRFPDLEALAQIMSEAGFADVRFETLTQGIVAIHSGIKR
jgi:demethylmenaquinone methyltransferase / 2-methoxy-6-polyprenyl-1,4-benzoquinol methylase